ncbi:MAG: hypothetical protein JWO22_3886, partial [Frankiales bacterium]|nr:hypothetical protein [Frankiales bacterium]
APITATQRSRLGTGICVLGLVAVVLAASGAPPAVRAPFVLLAAMLLPAYPLVARLKVDLPTLLAIDVAASLALEAGLALLTVELRAWHPQLLGLALACFSVGGTFVTLTSVRHAEARHLS